MHKPVLLETVLSYLNLRAGSIVLDATVGSGGHAEAILKAIEPQGILIGLDQDEEALRKLPSTLKAGGRQVILKHSNFRDLDRTLSELNLSSIDAVLLDIGLSSDQLEDPARGFSFQKDGPLDMRMDRRVGRAAGEILASSDVRELTRIFQQFGEERFSGRIANAIMRARAKVPIQTTGALKRVIEQATPIRYHFGRIHPATRVFQALRIIVNDELNALEEALPKAISALKPGGRIAVITFHSLEDRIVKRFFLAEKAGGRGKIITKKPIRPSDDEVQTNPRARSAKLRIFERS